MASAMILLILVAVIGGIALWVKRSRTELARGERASAADDGGSPRRISLLTEAVGYIGTILVLAGAGSAIGQQWDEVSTAWRLVILVAGTLLFLGVGLVVRPSDEPAFKRLTGVTWAVSVAGFAGSVAVVNQFYETAGETAFITIALLSTGYAALLWLFHQHAIQQAVLFGGVLLSWASIVVFANPSQDIEALLIAIPLWAIGLGWAAAGWWRLLAPWFVAVPLGVLAALIAPAFIGEFNAARFSIGIGTAATIMALSVVAKFAPGLAIASVALLGYVVGAVVYYFGDAIGAPASLAITGLLILMFAAAAARWHWFSRRHPPQQQPPTEGGGPQRTPREHHRAA
jgi:hypothetical protein